MMIQKNCSRQGSKYASNLIIAQKKKQLRNWIVILGTHGVYFRTDILR